MPPDSAKVHAGALPGSSSELHRLKNRRADRFRMGDERMNSNGSPLEHLAAFAITFALGMATTAALGVYARFVKRNSTPTTAHQSA